MGTILITHLFTDRLKNILPVVGTNSWGRIYSKNNMEVINFKVINKNIYFSKVTPSKEYENFDKNVPLFRDTNRHNSFLRHLFGQSRHPRVGFSFNFFLLFYLKTGNNFMYFIG